jgi:hypothetical protein
MDRPYDLFLTWLSEREEGTWDDFKAAHSWLFGLSAETARRKPSWTVHLLTTLGHLEMDWLNGRWSVTQPCLVNLPSAGATAVLVGSRPSSLVQRLLDATGDDATLDLVVTEFEPADGPQVIYVQYGSDADILGLASLLGARFERYAAGWMSAILSPIADQVLDSRETVDPPRGYDLALFSPSRLTWEAAANAVVGGLYRNRAYGLDRYWLKAPRGTHEVDRDLGVWASLAAADRHVLQYQGWQINGALEVPLVARLPHLQARTAVLCSGRPPVRSDRRTVQYLNVPRSIATRIAASLEQVLVDREGAPDA